MDLMVDPHVQLSMGVAVPCIVDALPKELMVEGVVQGQGEERVEGSQDLIFDSSWLYLRGGPIEHFLEVSHVCFVEGLHSFEGHVVGDVDGLDSLVGRQPEAEEAPTEGKLLVVGQLVRQH